MRRRKKTTVSRAMGKTDRERFRPNSRPPDTIALPKPDREGGKSVLASLQARRTDRCIGSRRLPPQALSNLLWAAFGVNRGKGRGPFGHIGRTAGSASNAQEVDIYVALPEGIYLYDAVPQRLRIAAAGDLRRLTISRGQRDMLGDAPVHLIYVADVAKYKTAGFQEPGLWDGEVQKSYYNVAVGLIAGNVDLFAASMGLSSWFHNCDKDALARALKLRPKQRALFAQTVGYHGRR
jgi:hypothetical protein